ncbi:MAG TPA: 23S rRNA (cytosine(1962)-C(5))-methyltransferase RlmI, partial [Thermoanaerobaculia bacterium]|nr:23S rRNA (cytosine(1962)-C(5))-methyltransferase RlmI [Thermoanaerobaculia bacterium]
MWRAAGERAVSSVKTAAVHLKPGRDKAVREGHPWVFSGAIDKVRGPADSPVAEVYAGNGEPLGLGFYSPLSQIRVRMLGPDAKAADRAWFGTRLASAAALRKAVLPPPPEITTGYRVLNAEGDGVPGWTVDVFGDALVSQITVAGLEAVRAEAYAALSEAFPGLPILQANDVPSRRAEGLSQEDEIIAGEPPAEAAFQE